MALRNRNNFSTFIAVLIAGLALLIAAAPADAMKSKRIGKGLCETTGGGKIVDIPGFPGERIDRRLLRDIRYLKRRYDIFVTDGYSKDPVHSANGEHPMGLALDIAPSGRRWGKIDRLARWAEPSQNAPRAPFRWVGYDGDAGHGSGHHLHLSWNHDAGQAGEIQRTVYTMKCPGKKKRKGNGDGGQGDGQNGGGGNGGGQNGSGNGGQNGGGQGGSGSGGISPGSGGGKGGGNDGGGGGGIKPKRAFSPSVAAAFDLSDIVIETGGVGR